MPSFRPGMKGHKATVMIKHLFIISALLISAGIQAQPTLTSPAFTPGFRSVYHNVPFNNAGPAGASQTWNFSALTSIDSQVNKYVSCISTPYCGQFPGATVVIDQNPFYTY